MDAHHYYQYQVFRHQLNKLQAHKSSFQAWKCVSLGYALFATVLLAAKWHEVSTDLKLLQGIDQLLWSQQSTGANSTASQLTSLAEVLAVAEPLTRLPLGRPNRSLSLAELAEESSSGDESPSSGPSLAELFNTNTTTSNSSQSLPDSARGAAGSEPLVAHMQISLGRELNGNQLLKQEVEAFLAEFRSAKSTLGLSSLLVFVYIISWILMTLAVNDTRISNDVSLRNILLLSVFGAIDMAASVGFVMVRLIMILDSRSLRDAPLRLSSDQLTAFTALRLIGMRSCSAYVDAYVSTLVALLTVLRLYAVVRAIAYYRFLRRFNDFNRSLHHQNQLSAAMMMKQNQTSEKQTLWKVQGNQQLQQPSSTLQGFIAQNGAGPDLMRAPLQQWNQQPGQAQRQPIDTNGPATCSTTLRFSPEPPSGQNTGSAEQRVQHLELLSPNGKQQQVATLTFGDSTDEADQQQVVLNAAMNLNEQRRSGVAVVKSQQPQQFELADFAKTAVQTADEDQRQQPQQGKTLIKVGASKQWPPLMVVANNEPAISSDIEITSRANRSLGSTAPASVLLVNGRPHKLVPAGRHSNQNEPAARGGRNLMGYESTGGGFESEPVNFVSEARARSQSRDHQMRLLTARTNQIRMNSDGRFDHLFNQTNTAHARSQAEHSSFTLLSASQLDRLSRKLLAGATGSLALNPARGRRHQVAERVDPVNDSSLRSRYKPAGRHRPSGGDVNRHALERQVFEGANFASPRLVVQREDEDEGAFGYAQSLQRPQRKLVQHQQRRLEDLLDDSASGSSSSGPSSDSDEAPTARAATTPEMATNFLSLNRRNLSAGHHQQQHKRRHRRPETKPDARLLSAHADGRRHQARASLGSLRQTEELNLEPAADIGASRDHLLGKYYYA